MAKRKLTEEFKCPSCKQQYFRSPQYDEPACYFCKRNMERKGFYDAFVLKRKWEEYHDRITEEMIQYYEDMRKNEQAQKL